MVPPIITLTTDFGTGDPYVAAMKGVILSINPGALIVDISHEVRPQAIEQGSFLLAAALPYFPTGAIHVAVVDPGVGSERRGLAVATAEATFIGPDNGILSAALPDDLRAHAASPASPLPLPNGFRAVSLENERYLHRPVSSTLHGRDVFAPAAAHLSRGVRLEGLGPPLHSILALPPLRAQRQPDGSLQGRVVYIDRFGNLITDLRADDLPDAKAGAEAGEIVVEIAGQKVRGLRRAYHEGEGLIAYIGSAGYLEIALAGGSAAAALEADIATAVRLHRSR
ncbi:MAG: S-adenosyl-l-methionine hydroxide adenosyltransferase family protein [Dehalococcoidia bacterium]